MLDRIVSSIERIEQEEQVRVFYACESGSRAWGFASRDSDYDVRFLYVRPKDWYLSVDLELKRDVIERPIVDALDLNGWDLRKALVLLRKSNPPLLEWLGSPIVYVDKCGIAATIRAVVPESYSPVSCLYHYLHMARGNVREYLRGETVWLKKYFYVLRPLLAIQWIEKGYGIVPTEFHVLLDRLVEDPALKAAILDLLKRKQDGDELDRGPKIPVLSEFIKAEVARLDTKTPGEKRPRIEIERLNEIFRASLVMAWQ